MRGSRVFSNPVTYDVSVYSTNIPAYLRTVHIIPSLTLEKASSSVEVVQDEVIQDEVIQDEVIQDR